MKADIQRNGHAHTNKVTEELYSVMSELIDDNPKAKPRQLYRLYADVILNDPELNRAFVLKFAVFVHNVCDPTLHGKKRRRRQRWSATKDMLRRAALDFILPNGKTLRDCTFGEVGAYGEQFKKLASMGRPDQIIGEVLSEKRVRTIIKKKPR